MRPATTDEWIAACVEAWGRLCNGDRCHVERGKETWENAIARIAGEIFAKHGLGRPKGPVPKEWLLVLESVAERAPCSPDGLVEGPHGIRLGTKNLLRGAQFDQGSN